MHLFHARLAIQDISGGKQPVHFAKRYTIILNGEIYNHQELRRQFGLQCQSNSDTETLIQLFALQGPACLELLDGMFAFVIYDKLEQKLFIARDRAGKKPLYYYFDDQKLVFASELNALHRILPLQRCDEHIERYLRLGYFFRTETAYQKVYALENGTYLNIDIPSLSVESRRWWKIGDYYANKQADDFQTALDKTDKLLHIAVKRRIEASDLEVGSFLSGGIDSGLVTAIGSAYHNNIKTFTVSFEGQYDEAPLAKLVAERYGTQHHEIRISFEHLIQDVENILGNYGQPFSDSSAIPSYYVSQAARKHLTVILNGDGGDELFGGYRRYVPFSRFNFFNTPTLIQSAAKGLQKMLPLPHNKKNLYNYLYRLMDMLQKKGDSLYLSATSDIFEGYLDKAALKSSIPNFEQFVPAALHPLDRIMHADAELLLFSDLLIKMDIATMAHSLEGRSPFLSKELLEYIPGLQPSFKISGKQTKYLLRTLATRYLPEELIDQPKRGFEIPLKNWVNTVLDNMIQDYLRPSTALSRQFVDASFLDGLLSRKIQIPEEKCAKMLWSLFALEVWNKRMTIEKHA